MEMQDIIGQIPVHFVIVSLLAAMLCRRGRMMGTGRFSEPFRPGAQTSSSNTMAAAACLPEP